MFRFLIQSNILKCYYCSFTNNASCINVHFNVSGLKVLVCYNNYNEYNWAICARSCPKYFTRIISFNPHDNVMWEILFYPHFTDEWTKAWWAQWLASSLLSKTGKWQSQERNLLDIRIQALNLETAISSVCQTVNNIY